MKTTKTINRKDLENLLCDYFGSDPSYYPKEEVDSIERLINLTYNFAQKESEVILKQKLLDKLNHYKSNLQEETKVKLNRLANKEKIRELKIKIETIKDLMR